MRVAPDSLLPGRAFLYAFAQQDEETDPELGETQIPVSDLLLTSHTAQGTSENLSPVSSPERDHIPLSLGRSECELQVVRHSTAEQRTRI